MLVVYLVILRYFLFGVQSKIDDEVISISTFVGSSIMFPIDRKIEKQPMEWWRNQTKINFEIDRYRLINQTSFLIEQTIVGDQGFYTLNILTSSNKRNRSIRYHLLLFENNDLSLSLPFHDHQTYHVEELINLTCSIDFYADRNYFERFDTFSFSSIWSMIIYNNNPDRYELIIVSQSKFRFIGSLLQYEIDRNDHQQNLTCSLVEHRTHPIVIRQTTSIQMFNVKYKVFLRGQYFFIRSYPSHSSIEINCEEFDGNPSPLYTLFWNLNGINRTLLNKTKRGKFFIADATWRHRGIYTCFAENELNHQPAHQTFRLNIWFDEHRRTDRSDHSHSLILLSHSSSSRWLVVSLISSVFLLSFVLFILSLYCFCLQYHREMK